MNNIQGPSNRNFFPNSKNTEAAKKSSQIKQMLSKRNDESRRKELDDLSKTNAKVDINNKIKDFARIKKAVDMSPAPDNSDKIASLKAQIKSGQYSVDYDALADKILQQEF